MRRKISPLTVAVAIGATFTGFIEQDANADPSVSPFAITKLRAGYELVSREEGNSFEDDTADSCGGNVGAEGQCGNDDEPEGNCGGDKDSEGNCGGDKDSEGNCGGDKDSEGKCAEGRCGE